MTRFDETLHMVLNHTLDAVLPPFRAVFSQYDLTEQQWRVLRVLWDRGQVGFADLSDSTLIPRPSLVGILTRLEGRGLVHRERSDTDRRNVTIQNTDAGRAIAGNAMATINQLHADLRQAIPPDEWDAMQKSLTKIATYATDNMTPQRAKAKDTL